MKINLIYYATRYKNIIFFILFILLGIYSINSTSTIYETLQDYDYIYSEYVALNTKNNDILDEISDLEFKTQGLKDETINIDLLETQIKKHLNVARVKELVILH